jgi:hypothetical protein
MPTPDETSSPKISNLGVTVAELESIKADRKRVALMNAITARDFDMVAIDAQFVAMMVDSRDPLRQVYLNRLEMLIESYIERLGGLRAAYRNVAGRSHGRDPVKG